MIRINLLGAELPAAGGKPALDAGQRVTLACSLIFVAGLLGIGWWYWSLSQASAQVDQDLVGAQQEAERLRSVIVEVQAFEKERERLQQRVALIEELRAGQSVPVQLLDIVSRSLPDMLWLTRIDQSDGEVTIDGRSTTLIALSDFVGNLGGDDFFTRPVEIVDSQVETLEDSAARAPVDLIRFTVRAQLARAPSVEDDAGSPAP